MQVTLLLLCCFFILLPHCAAVALSVCVKIHSHMFHTFCSAGTVCVHASLTPYTLSDTAVVHVHLRTRVPNRAL